MSGTTTPSSDLSSFLGSDPSVNRLYDNVQGVVPAVQLPIVQMETWNTIEDFYIRSTLHRESVHWTMAIGMREVDFNPFDENWVVAWVLKVTGLSRFTVRPPGAVIDTDENVAYQRTGRALLALKPPSFGSATTCGCGDTQLWSNWFEPILDGVLWRLYRSPAKPYSSPQLATYHAQRFNGGVARARSFADSGFTDGGGRWGYPYFASGRRKN